MVIARCKSSPSRNRRDYIVVSYAIPRFLIHLDEPTHEPYLWLVLSSGRGWCLRREPSYPIETLGFPHPTAKLRSQTKKIGNREANFPDHELHPESAVINKSVCTLAPLPSPAIFFPKIDNFHDGSFTELTLPPRSKNVRWKASRSECRPQAAEQPPRAAVG